MNRRERENRLHQFIRSPGGRALLFLIELNDLALADVVKPPQALHLVSSAIGQLNPWASDRDAKLAMIASRGGHLGDLASHLIDTSGIEWWWAPMVRDRQIWIQPAKDSEFPDPDRFPTPIGTPGRDEYYAQRRYPRFSTSSEVAGTTSQLAEIVSGETDWWIDDYVAQRPLQCWQTTVDV
jgi:hypothetical protein